MTDDKRPAHENRAPEATASETEDRGRKKKEFVLPKLITHSGEDLLAELGPAHACSPFSGSVVGC